jgi:hypothetical protein
MINYEKIEKNKTKIINFSIFIIALAIAFKLNQSTNNQISSLNKQQNDELQNNKAVEDIAALEKKTEAYKKVFVKKDLASIMSAISGIAKNTSVKIISVKPFADDVFDNYSTSSFLITLNAPSYHALGDFISKIENHSDIYLVSEIIINSAVIYGPEVNTDLAVSLKINTIAYL